MILLAAIRPDVQPDRIKRIKTSELERLYAMIRKDRPDRPTG